MDSTDTYEDEEGEISAKLFTQEFFRDCQALLSENGFVVTQADNAVFCPYSLEEISAQYAKVFSQVGSYEAIVPSFGSLSAYCWASNGAKISQEWKPNNLELHYLNPTTYALAFADLPFKLDH